LSLSPGNDFNTPGVPYTGTSVTLDTPSGLNGTKVSNIETIIANPTNLANSINFNYRNRLVTAPKEMFVDLSQDRVDFFYGSDILQTLTAKNFKNVTGASRVVGNDLDNVFEMNQFVAAPVIGSKGNDTISFGIPDYSNLGRAVTFSPTQFGNGLPIGTIDKGSFGKDTASYLAKVIGAINKTNTVDGTTAPNGATLNINLATNSVVGNLFGSGWTFEVINFVNAVGTKNNDTIVGSNANGKLTGGGGNDTITGGTGNDRITGTDSTARGVGEVDPLTGGGGRDKFILGDRNGAYYLGNGSNDYATITDFNLTRDSIDLGGFKDYSFGFDGANTIDLFSGKDANTRDLIAKIQLADLGLTAASKGAISNGKSLAMASMLDGGASTGIEPIFSKIDILSGANAIEDAVI
jgi:RTX calcium-binding nonapeptide repeat (4 copies)